MSDRSPDGPRPGGWVPPPAEATREITLPPMADRPGPAVRPEWASYVPAPPQAPSTPTAQPELPQQPPPFQPQPPQQAPQAPPAPLGVEPAPIEHVTAPEQPHRPHDPPTDRLVAPQEQRRSSTLSFQPPPQVQLLKVSVGPSRRSGWIWAIAILVPLLIILGSGIWLVLLFYGG